ncbi:3-oxoacyl-[acyl-carrier-protein] synthase III C-terminal domain-containing protein [Streptomyces sp. P9(2023)]|uniref:3-oxoacyl-ACP synthase III family protein n=1 Tax=Streptomyces sp. P9(2023) TaxID=3064394 RepID=UPI0028F41562|nr:3-oxoacyl-[acyl-carrier-protein] synthase III C-terminal domain-containing protein [Streptomyces sp. P9(2023)]MDT9692487.1 3-oxoacyl-[acyl-carrier-protein] synthase III C-terminal domain-containing protein [Streptomyces sp. P9(2023)]
MGGIVDFDVCFPSARADVHAMHAASGVALADIVRITHCESFPVLADDEQAWELALTAARTVIRRTGVAPSAVRQVVYAGSGEWDRPFWSPAAKVAHGLGIEDAHCFEVANFCNAGMTAIRLLSGPGALAEGEYALVLVGDRLSRMVDHGDPDSKALFNFGDAAAAVLLAGGAGRFRVLHSAMRTDGGWADYYHGELTGDRVRIRRAAHRRGLADTYVRQFTGLVHETLAALEVEQDDIAHFLINHGDRDMHERLLRTLGIPAERSVFNYHRLAHMGGADTLIALGDLERAGRLRPGDLIMLATSAMGFSWGITTLEYQG